MRIQQSTSIERHKKRSVVFFFDSLLRFQKALVVLRRLLHHESPIGLCFKATKLLSKHPVVLSAGT